MILNKQYQIIYADPPWRQFKGGLRKCRPNQNRNLDYSTLSLGCIQGILSKIDAPILFLWTIDKFLFEAQKISENIGYRLHARMIWDKMNGVAPAFTVRYSHEYLLWLYKKPMLKITKDMRGKQTTVFSERATKHSKKPQKAYEIIESFYPNANRIELFAREHRDGWDSWGDELV